MTDQSEYEVAVRLGRPFDIRLTDGWYLSSVGEIRVPFSDQASAEAAAGEIGIVVRVRADAADDKGELRQLLAARKDEIISLRRALADKDAEIARLQAELDSMRDTPVEYVTEAGLEAAMVADPGRQDGTVLRVTDGGKQAWQWKARTREWVPIQ